MSQPLIPLPRIEAWSGLGAFYAAFEAKGYRAHLPYIDLVRASGENDAWRGNLMLYWEERARELLSAGYGAYNEGRIDKEGYYRSAFINELAQIFPAVDCRGMPLSFHPCIAAYDERRRALSYGGLKPGAARYFDPQTPTKVDEYNRYGLSAAEWDGSSKSFAALFKEKALRAGFTRGKSVGREEMNALWFWRKSPAGTVFGIGYQKVGWLGIVARLPFEFWVSPSEISPEMSGFGLSAVIPGLDNYLLFERVVDPPAFYSNPEETAKCATIGIQAVLDAYAILIDSL